MNQLAETREQAPVTKTKDTLKVAYIVARFPKLTETFILYEILSVEANDVSVELYPLIRERTAVMHPEAAALVERAHFQPFVSWNILRAHLHFIKSQPRDYFGALWTLLRETWGSLRFFTGALALFPKSVYMAQLMRRDGIQHIQAHFASHPAAAAFVIHRLVGIPYSFTAHGSDLHRDRHMLKEKVEDASFVVAISKYNQELILSECGEQYREKVFTVHCGVDTDVFRFNPTIPPQTPEHVFSILCIGTLHEVKGQTYLVEACRLLKERGIPLKCSFVGSGPDRDALLKQIRECGLEDSVELLGPRTRDEIIALLPQADAVAVPSVPTKSGKREGIPVVLMEAMASGVPVVASKISGIPELVEDGVSGLLVPPRDAQGLADALEWLWSEPELRQCLRLAAREKVVQEFNVHRNAQVLAQHFYRASFV